MSDCIKPLKLLSQRVWRTYLGGMKIEQWQGLESPHDDHFPEEWVASVVSARNPGREHITDEGLSKTVLDDGTTVTLKSLVEQNPEAMLGKAHYAKYGCNTGVLVKGLDAAERLAIQVHPDRATAKRLFNSDFGKTESWYVIGGREVNGEKPHIYFGFKKGITRERWQDIFERQDIEEMLGCLHKFYVNEGDVYLIEGGLPHAIGAGCFLIEVQEPTDYTIRTERKTPSGLTISDAACHQGLGFERMFECFNYEGYETDEILRKYKLTEKKPGELITYDDTEKFALMKLSVTGEALLPEISGFYVVVALKGEGGLVYKDGQMDIKQSDQIFMPDGLNGVKATSKSGMELLICRPPRT